MKIKQFFCLHWFDERPSEEYRYSAGHIICNQQKTFMVIQQTRICSKCKFEETRNVSDPVCEGWF